MSIIESIVPAGSVYPFATYKPATASSPGAPPGFLLCNGAEVSRTTYANLFSVIGVSFGSGNSSTTFNLPDFRGIFLRGRANASANDPNRTTRTSTFASKTKTTKTITFSASSATVTTADTSSLWVGMTLSGAAGIPTNAYITAITNATTFTISAASTAAGTSLSCNFSYSFGLSCTYTSGSNIITTASTEVLRPGIGVRGPGYTSTSLVILAITSSTTFTVGSSSGVGTAPTSSGTGIYCFEASPKFDYVGSYQDMATGRPVTNFTISTGGTHTHGFTFGTTASPSSGAAETLDNDSSGASWSGYYYTRTDSATYDGSHTHSAISGGDAETRPDNLYLAYYIKY